MKIVGIPFEGVDFFKWSIPDRIVDSLIGMEGVCTYHYLHMKHQFAKMWPLSISFQLSKAYKDLLGQES